MTDNRVEVLCPGMIRRDGAVVLEARSSVSLVSQGERHLLVDTSGPQNRDLLLRVLGSRGIAPDDIEMVIMTHLHHDHDGNIDLFPKAERYAHRLESPGRSYHAVDGNEEIWNGVRLMHTPGHTMGSISVLVEAEERYGLVGDAIPTEDNARKWVPPGHHYDRGKAMESMSRLVNAVDIIVPGHGPSFRAADYRRER